MSIPDGWRARWPNVARAKGHYESFYLKAGHPTRPTAVWIRYTVHKAPGSEAVGSTWFTYFEHGRAPVARKATYPAPRTGKDRYISVGESVLAPGRARGASEDAAWDLAIQPLSEPLFHLPKGWMYGSPLPRTKLVSPAPEAVFTGRLEIGGRTVELDGWSGMLGHNWGAEHAERWIWLHAIFEPGTWIDVALGRIRIAGWTTPWVANGVLSLGGRRDRLGGIGAAVRTRINEDPAACTFELPGDLAVKGRVDRPLHQTVAWPYRDPGGSTHHSLNCSISALDLDVGNGRRLHTSYGAVYELGVREDDHDLPVLPYEDGIET